MRVGQDGQGLLRREPRAQTSEGARWVSRRGCPRQREGAGQGLEGEERGTGALPDSLLLELRVHAGVRQETERKG